jgi:hypothetical protein
MKTKIKKLTAIKPMTFETAMAALRRGKAIRRRAWHPECVIFRLGADVFVKLPNRYERGPSVWRPYPNDFLANDWAQVKS